MLGVNWAIPTNNFGKFEELKEMALISEERIKTEKS